MGSKTTEWIFQVTNWQYHTQEELYMVTKG